MRLPARYLIGTAMLAAVMVTAADSVNVEAHKGVTSRYTYNEDVFPILRDRCGRCHAEGGPTPMSLLTYDENGGAVAWAESIREMLLFEAMPPWYVDPMSPTIKNTHRISARELDILITWATGGTPRGDLNKRPAPVAFSVQWPAGTPDLAIPMDKEHTVAAGTQNEIVEFTLPTNLTKTQWVKAADLLPGTPSIVRRAVISIENGPVLAVWEPGDDVAMAPNGTAFRLAARANLHVQIHYKKRWQDEQQPKSDRSTVGLYFTDEPLSGREIQAVAVDGPESEDGSLETRTFSTTLSSAGRLLAIRPSLDQPYASVDIQVQLPTSRRIPLLKLRAARPEWPRRYWLVDPVELPAGAKVEITATPGSPDEGPLVPPTHNPLQIAFDLVPL